MQDFDKDYKLTAFDEIDIEDRKRHEEEMYKAEERLENAKRRKRKTLFCALAGFIVGVLYIVLVAMGTTKIALFFDSVAKGNSIIRLLLDFAPPVLLAGISAFFIARGEKAVVTYIITSILVFFIVLFVFLVYLGLMSA